MFSLPHNRRNAVHFGIVMLALIVVAMTSAAALIVNDPFVPWLVIATLFAGVIGIYLLRRPVLALYVALFLYLLPTVVQIESNVLGVAMFVAFALALLAWLLHATSQRQPILWNWVYILLAVYIVWCAVTLVWAPDIVAGRREMIAYGLGFVLLFLIANQVRSLNGIDGLMRVLAMIGWILVLLSMKAVLFDGYQLGERLRVMDMNANGLGIVLILMVPGVIWPVLRSSGPRRNFLMALSVIYILCTVVLVALSGSRGSVLSLIAVLLAFGFWRPLRPWALVGVILVACMLATVPFLFDTLVNRTLQQEGGAFGGRAVLWEGSMLLLEDHPWTGVGVGNGPYQLAAYVASLGGGFSDELKVSSHSPLLQVGIDTGFVGMFVYLSMCVVAVWQFVRLHGRLYIRSTALSVYFPIVLCVTVGFLVPWLKGGGMQSSPIFFVMLALLVIPSQVSLAFYSTSNRSTDTLVRAPQHFFNRLPWKDPHGGSLRAQNITTNEGEVNARRQLP